VFAAHYPAKYGATHSRAQELCRDIIRRFSRQIVSDAHRLRQPAQSRWYGAGRASSGYSRSPGKNSLTEL
jgi:hypothetical protein